MMLPGLFQGQNSVCSQFNYVDAVQRRGAAHFVANRQHWLTAGAVIRRNERQAFRSKITGHTRLQIRLGYQKISIIQILDKLRILGISNVVDHDAANSLQSNKRESLAIDYAYGHRLRLRALVVRSIVEGIFVIVAVEVVGDQASGDSFEFAAAVENTLAFSAPDTE